MYGLTILATALLASVANAELSPRAVSASAYSDLEFYWQYAQAAYQPSCSSPNGKILVASFNNATSDTQGYIARDDSKKEIVVAFRGTSSQQDFTTDFDFQPVPYVAGGAFPPSGTLVHRGFQGAYISVQNTVLSTVRSQIFAHPTYSLVITGHSLGAGIASVAVGSFKGSFPISSIRLYTYGQPRTGNPTYANWVDQLLGQNSHRFVHDLDSVPLFVPRSLGFEHHGVEYWQFAEPPSAANVKQCTGNEDPTCSVQNPSVTFINQDHLVYFGDFFYTKQFCS